MKIERYRDKDVVMKEAGRALQRVLEDLKDIPVLMMFAGGSALGIIDLLDAEVFRTNVTMTVTDERYARVSRMDQTAIKTEDDISNFASITKTSLYQVTHGHGAQNIDPRTETEEEVLGQSFSKKMSLSYRKKNPWGRHQDTLESRATQFELDIRTWTQSNSRGKIVITQGMGVDGHTAGIMPFPENVGFFQKTFNNPDRWAVGYDATGKNDLPLRMTVTLPFLREFVDYAIVYATGEDKKEALMRATADTGTLEETPARIIREMKNVMLFTDQEI